MHPNMIGLIKFQRVLVLWDLLMEQQNHLKYSGYPAVCIKQCILLIFVCEKPTAYRVQ
jgi:hypothetical protein